MKSLTQAALFLLCFNPVTLRAVELVDGRSSLIFENSKSRLVIDLAGGSYREFRFLDDTVNPFNWCQPRPGVTNPKVMGHFLCLDRWGPPSVSEGANGMPYHGEAGSVVWQVD